MAQNTPLAGTAYFTADGTPYNLAAECTYDPGSVTRETLTGMDHVHGYSEKPKSPVMKAKLRDAGTLTVANFNAMRGNTIVFELTNGKVVTGRGMWTVDAQEVNTEDATFSVTWNGADGAVIETLAS